MNPDNVKVNDNFKDTSQPAFPATEANGLNSGTHGMTLRDYFAAAALQGLLASDVFATVPEFAAKSYEMADCMLKAREA